MSILFGYSDIMKFMTRDTQSNIITNQSTVFPVDISPLNKSGSDIDLTALGANRGFAEPSHQPLVKTSIANGSPLPSIISLTGNLLSLGSSPFFGSRTSFNKPSFIISCSHVLHCRNKFGKMQV